MEIKYKERTNEELKAMREDMKNVVVYCTYSDGESCNGDCVKFDDCWKYNYTSKLERAI